MLKKINSKYIIQEIFKYMNFIKVLELVRYNKDIKNQLEVSKKNYEKIFNSINIEIIPKDNLEFNENKQNIFINFLGDRNYYHIFFEDSAEEIDRNFIQKGDKIKKIKITIEPEFNSLRELFKDCECIKEISFTKFNRTDIIDMKEMFYGCHSLTKINFLRFNTENVTDMSQMFMQCSDLDELDVSIFNTSNVTDMSFMFSQCSAMKDLDLSNFNTAKVTEMVCMFFVCSKLEKLNLSSFNFDNVIHMKGMFNFCSSLIDLDFPQTNLDKATDTKCIFSFCKKELFLMLILRNANLISKNVWGVSSNKL